MFLKIIKFDSNFTNLLDYLLSRALGIYGYRGGQSATLIRIGQSDNPVLIKHIEPFLTLVRLDDHFCPACAFSSSSEDQLIQQLEFYFSQDNITTDFYLRSQMDEEVRDLWFLCEIYLPVELCTYHDNIDICQSQAVYWGCQRPRAVYCHTSSKQERRSTGSWFSLAKVHALQVDDYGLKIRAQAGPVKYRLVVREVSPSCTRDDIQQMFNNCDVKMLRYYPKNTIKVWQTLVPSQQGAIQCGTWALNQKPIRTVQWNIWSRILIWKFTWRKLCRDIMSRQVALPLRQIQSRVSWLLL